MGKARWVGVHQQRLYWWSLAKLAEQYPDYSKDTLKGKKYPLIKKVKEGKIPMPEKPPESNEQHEGQLPNANMNAFEQLLKRSGIDPDNIAEIKEMTVWQSAKGGEDGEWDQIDNHGMRLRPKQTEELDKQMFFTQAAPVVIKPSRARMPKRPFERNLFFSDTQIAYRYYDGEYHPIHDEAAMAAARGIMRITKPDRIHNMGDSVDFPTYSRWDADSTHFNPVETTQMAINRAHEFWAQIIADTPFTKEYNEVDSNHTVRFDKMALKGLSQAVGLRRAGEMASKYPFLTYAWVMNFEQLGVKFHAGYDAAEQQIYPDMIGFHGKEVRSNGSTAHLRSNQHHNISTVSGHKHTFEIFTVTDRDGKQHYHIIIPALCDMWGNVSGYHSAVDPEGHPVRKNQGWQQGVVTVDVYPDGEKNIQFYEIRDGIAHVGDIEVDGNKILEQEPPQAPQMIYRNKA